MLTKLDTVYKVALAWPMYPEGGPLARCRLGSQGMRVAKGPPQLCLHPLGLLWIYGGLTLGLFRSWESPEAPAQSQSL